MVLCFPTADELTQRAHDRLSRRLRQHGYKALTATLGAKKVKIRSFALPGMVMKYLDGKFVALKVDTIANMGAYLSTFAPAIPTFFFSMSLRIN